jgi:hypothetical protein
MDFKKAEIALQNSALSSVVSADFSPETITLTFPDSYQQKFSNVDVLPAVSHTVIDPSKTPRASPGATTLPGGAATSASKGSMNVTSSPLNVKVYLDSRYIGDTPSVFPEIDAGTHMVEFQKESYESASKNGSSQIYRASDIRRDIILRIVLARSHYRSYRHCRRWILFLVSKKEVR